MSEETEKIKELAFWQTCFSKSQRTNRTYPLCLRSSYGYGGKNGRDTADLNQDDKVASFIHLNTSAAEKSLPLNHISLCENTLGISHVKGTMKGFYMEMKGYE